MSHRSFDATMRALIREAARVERARQQAVAKREAAQRRALRETERQAKADAKEEARLYLAAQIEEAETLTREIQERETVIDTLLARALAKNPVVEFDTLLKTFTPGHFDERPWIPMAPSESGFMPKPPGFFARLIPGTQGRYERRVKEAQSRFGVAEAEYQEDRRARAAALDAFVKAEEESKTKIERENEEARELQRGLAKGEHASVVAYCKLLIDHSLDGEPDALSAEIGFSPDSRHLVVDLELPELSSVPEEAGFKYVKSADRIDPVLRPIAKRKALYAHLISQIALKCIDVIFRGSPAGIIDCATLNGMLDTIDPATGQQARLCLLSVQITADTFRTLNLAQVEPERCLRSLKAAVSRAPAELLPVKPFVELDTVDPGFVETMDVISGADSGEAAHP